MITIDLLRHGAVEGGVKYRGVLDDPLTAEGRKSMDDVWQHLQGSVTTIMSSPLSRCAQPALDWGKQQRINCLLDARIQELNYGEWEGLNAEEIEVLNPDVLSQWRADPTYMTPPKGESMLSFAERTKLFLDEVTIQHQGEHILLVAHSGTLRLLIAHVLSAPIVSTRHLAMPYSCWSRIQLSEDGNLLVFHARPI